MENNISNKNTENLINLIPYIQNQLLNKKLQGNKFILYTKDIFNIMEIFELIINKQSIENKLFYIEHISYQIQLQIEDYIK
ncbi:hypothetical protein [Clostridium prolinivorans]|uniref:hypothetical protein n=1 Tax=Clostridium prolinivorans TaxID=2769420 RepID=UPI000FDBB283|nr:hypothetical protein [Clostridium prolinivorans]